MRHHDYYSHVYSFERFFVNDMTSVIDCNDRQFSKNKKIQYESNFISLIVLINVPSNHQLNLGNCPNVHATILEAIRDSHLLCKWVSALKLVNVHDDIYKVLAFVFVLVEDNNNNNNDNNNNK
jgi:hypothetical protein